MNHLTSGRIVIVLSMLCMLSIPAGAQKAAPRPVPIKATQYTGIEVGAKGVKMSVVEIGKNAKTSGAFAVVKDTSVNTDFISFNDASFAATLNGLTGLYTTALNKYKIPSTRIFTVISSGVKMQAEKDQKNAFIGRLIDSFRVRLNEPSRVVEVVDVEKEAILSHLGIVPENRRYSTFLVDIGSGNTKGGYFPDGNTQHFKLFQLNWGTKSVYNATDKRCEGDVSLVNFNKQLARVLLTAENNDIIYAVNTSGAYALSDNIALSGGIAWAAATLMHPEQLDDPVISVSFDELIRYNDKLYENFNSLKPEALAARITDPDAKAAVLRETARVHSVFDQKSLMSGTGLLLKIMRQFSSVFETKQFYLIKNGQVGWVSAYVDQSIH